MYLFQRHNYTSWLFSGIFIKCSWTSICLPVDLSSLSQVLPGARWEMPYLLLHYGLHWFENKWQFHYRSVCSLQLSAVTQGTSAPKLVKHFNHSTQLEKFQGKPVSSKIGKDIINKEWSLSSPVHVPFFHSFIRISIKRPSAKSCTR